MTPSTKAKNMQAKKSRNAQKPNTRCETRFAEALSGPTKSPEQKHSMPEASNMEKENILEITDEISTDQRTRAK
jgi:hypothetical protein